MSLPTYEEYRHSGERWLETVPAHWQVYRLKNLFEIRKRIVGEEGHQVLSITQRGIKVKDIESNDGQLSMDYSKYQVVQPGDFAMNHMDLLTGFVDISPYAGVTSPDYRVFTVRDEVLCEPRYFLYLLQNGYRKKIFYAFGQGASEFGRWRFPTDQFNDFRFPVPPLDEQVAIVAFLDHELSNIEALITEQEKLLELLAEKRQATISHAITRGLNPDVPLKDSGAEWLGTVPEHWCAVPLKHLCTLLKDGTHLPPPRVDIGVPLLSVRNIEDSVFSTREDDSMISTDDYDVLCRAFVPAAGDILMAIVGATLGKVAIIPDGLGNFHIQRSLAIFRPNESLLAKWLFYCISSGTFQRMLWENVGFSAQPGIYLGTLKDFKFPLPSLPEQAEVCAFLDGEVEKLNALKAEATHAIELLNERRSALIFAAVTGKIDVRERSSALAAAA
ncbi:restriction endonuclease subunit S [Burkholderia gladioli]|uniref:restriction endonuclease subunit S n=1 Tax=Burkholderia gladioli TaxID=28095 RepID=UPI00163E11E6|nr:restriction endonuclease subunit S [Burkholderia gladioli]